MLTRYELRERNWASFSNIMIFSRDLGDIVVAPYPITENGQPITPGGVHRFIARRGLEWECECARFSDRACTIRWTGPLRTIGTCFHKPPQCGLYLDLNRLVNTASQRDRYLQYPTLARISNEWNRPMWPIAPRRAGGTPIMPRRRHSYGFHRLHPYERPLELARQRTRLSLPEYLPSNGFDYTDSETDSDKENIPIEKGSGNSKAVIPIARGSNSSQGNTASGSGAPSSPSTSSDGLDESERVLLRLLGGEGISWFDQRYLIEECNSCKKFFLNTYLRPHIIECSADDEAPVFDKNEPLFLRARSVSVEV